MMLRSWGYYLRRIKGRSPSFLIRKLLYEFNRERYKYLHRLGRSPYKVGNSSKVYSAQADIQDFLIHRGNFQFFFSLEERKHIAQKLAKLFPDDIRKAIAKADMVCSNTFDFLGSGPRQLDDDINWNRDFKSGIEWLPGYYLDYDYWDLDRPSDVKVVWELGRLQYLMVLGRAYFYTEDDKYLLKYMSLVKHWAEKNPVGSTIGWACTMDVSLRAVSLIWGLYFFLGTDGIRKEFINLCVDILIEHGKFIYRNIEFSDINGNHYISSMVGLIYLGLFLQEVPESRKWLRTGLAGIEKEIQLETYNDGVCHEGSIPYHRLVTEMFISSIVLCKRNNIAIHQNTLTRLEKMLEFVMAYVKPDGTAPIIGDADDGRVHILGSQDINDHRYLLSTGAALFQRGDMKSASSRFWEESAWLLGLEGWRKYEELTPGGTIGSRAFADGGFFFLRHKDDYVAIDCGDVGLRGRGGHGHNDVLSFVLVLDGQDIITDSGCFTYTASREMRKNYISAFAHNVAMIDGTEPSTINEGGIAHVTSIETKLIEWNTEDDSNCFIGEHYGYKRLDQPVIYRRQICLPEHSGSVLIKDMFQGSGHHQIEIRFHFAPEWQLHNEDQKLYLTRDDSGQGYYIEWSVPEIDFCCEKSYYSPSYGVRIPRYSAVFSASRYLPFECVFRIKRSVYPRV